MPQPPQAPIEPHTISQHGVTRVDPYAWMRDDNWQTVMKDPDLLAPKVRAHLEAENAYLEEVLSPVTMLRKTLAKEMRGRIKEDDSSVPAPDGHYAYLVRYEEGGQYPKYCRTPRDGGAERVLLDGVVEAQGHTYFNLGGFDHSPNHELGVWSVDTQGSEYYELRVRNLQSGKDMPTVIPDTEGSVVWSSDSGSFFYVRLDDNHRPRFLMRHRIGADPASDTLVYEETDPAYFMGIGETESRAFLTIVSSASETTEIRVLPLEEPESAPRLVAPRIEGRKISLSHRGEHFYFLTNADGAEDFRVVIAPVTDPDPVNWQEIVPHEYGRLILDIHLLEDYFIRFERVRGLPRIVVSRFSGTGEPIGEDVVAFDDEAYGLGLMPGYEFDTSVLRYAYSSPRQPRQTVEMDLDTGARTVRKVQEVPSGHDPNAYTVRRLEVPSEDGTLVPVTILHKRDLPLDGTAPCLLYGYGAYGITIPAGFSTTRLSLVDRGFVYAIAHVRGGKDMGYHWYTDGKLASKRNSFVDFVAAGRGLVAAGYTGEGRIVAHGGSAGGLLVGAAMNLAPDLFRGVIAEVPFVDVLTTISDASLPLTPPEWTEWGDPIRDAEAYRTIASYSPYDNVAPGPSPHLLATAGLSDPRVTYWEPAKWVARVRALRTDPGLTLLKTNMTAGHSGASGRFDQLDEDALVYAFALMLFDEALMAPYSGD